MEDPGVDGGIILRRVFRRWGRYGLDLFGSEHGEVAGSCKCGDEPQVSINFVIS